MREWHKQAEPQPALLDERVHFPALQWPQPSRGTAARGSQWISDRQHRTLVGPRWERVSPGWIGDRRDLFSGAQRRVPTRTTTIGRDGPRTTTGQQHSSQQHNQELAAVGPSPCRNGSTPHLQCVTGRLWSTSSSAACPSLAWPSRPLVHFDNNLLSAGPMEDALQIQNQQTPEAARRSHPPIVTSHPASRPSCGRWQVTNPTPLPSGAGFRGPNTDWAWAALRGCVGRVPSPVPRTVPGLLVLLHRISWASDIVEAQKRYMETCTVFFPWRSVPPLPKPRDVAVNPGPILFAHHPPTTGRTRTSSQPTETRSGWTSSPWCHYQHLPHPHQDRPLYMYLLPGRQAGEMDPERDTGMYNIHVQSRQRYAAQWPCVHG